MATVNQTDLRFLSLSIIFCVSVSRSCTLSLPFFCFFRLLTTFILLLSCQKWLDAQLTVFEIVLDRYNFQWVDEHMLNPVMCWIVMKYTGEASHFLAINGITERSNIFTQDRYVSWECAKWAITKCFPYISSKRMINHTQLNFWMQQGKYIFRIQVMHKTSSNTFRWLFIDQNLSQTSGPEMACLTFSFYGTAMFSRRM